MSILIKTLKTWLKAGFSACLVFSINVHSQALLNKNVLPDIGVVAADAVPLSKEVELGDALMRQLRGQAPMIQDPLLTQYLQDLGNRLVVHADNAYFPFTFFLLNDSAINAFAFFGGHIGMHSGLIARADNESEIASVLAHEIAHVTQRHIARRMQAQQRTSTVAIASMIGGLLLAMADPQAGMAAIQASNAASQQFAIDYTRSNEQEADRVGITMMHQAGFDARGAASFFSKLTAETRMMSKPPARLLTHPLSETRVADARARILSLPRRYVPKSLSFQLAKARILSRYHFDKRYAEQYFENASQSKLNTNNEANQYGYAMALMRNGKSADAYPIVRKLLQKRPNNTFYLDVATDLLIELGKPENAIDLLRDQYQKMPQNPVLALNLANAHLKAKSYDRAIAILRDFLLTNKENQLAHQLLSEAYREDENKGLMHQSKAEVYALAGVYQLAVDELQFAYNHASDNYLSKQRIRARIKQFRGEIERLKTL